MFRVRVAVGRAGLKRKLPDTPRRNLMTSDDGLGEGAQSDVRPEKDVKEGEWLMRKLAAGS